MANGVRRPSRGKILPRLPRLPRRQDAVRIRV